MRSRARVVPGRVLLLAVVLAGALVCPAVVAGEPVPPKLLDAPAPKYPEAERALGHEGGVVLSFVVRKNGRVGEVSVATSSGFTGLDEAAIAAARKWRFAPARDAAGKPVESTIQRKLSFKLEVADASAPAVAPPLAELYALGYDYAVLFTQTCEATTAQLTAFRNAYPQAGLPGAPVMRATQKVIAMVAKEKPARERSALLKRAPAAMETAAARCARQPEAVYWDVVRSTLEVPR
jgi:TonB family protein